MSAPDDPVNKYSPGSSGPLTDIQSDKRIDRGPSGPVARDAIAVSRGATGERTGGVEVHPEIRTAQKAKEGKKKVSVVERTPKGIKEKRRKEEKKKREEGGT